MNRVITQVLRQTEVSEQQEMEKVMNNSDKQAFHQGKVWMMSDIEQECQ